MMFKIDFFEYGFLLKAIVNIVIFNTEIILFCRIENSFI
jgi:hypothetical protein